MTPSSLTLVVQKFNDIHNLSNFFIVGLLPFPVATVIYTKFYNTKHSDHTLEL